MASQDLRAHSFRNPFLIMFAVVVLALAFDASVRAQNPQVEADATKAAQLEAYRALLIQKDQANPSLVAADKGKEYAADTEAMELVNKNYDGPNGAKSTLFHSEEVKVSNAIMADPSAHQAELDQIDAQMTQDAKLYTQRPAPTSQTTSKPTPAPKSTQTASGI